MTKINLKELLNKCKQNSVIIKKLQNEIDNNKKIFNKYFESKGIKNFEFEGNSCYQIERNKFIYNIKKIEKSIDKELCNLFIDKKISVNLKIFKLICKKII